jgi:hypothetical protein
VIIACLKIGKGVKVNYILEQAVHCIGMKVSLLWTNNDLIQREGKSNDILATNFNILTDIYFLCARPASTASVFTLFTVFEGWLAVCIN